MPQLPTVTYNEAALDFAASGDTTVITGVANEYIKVYKVFFVVGGTVNVTFKDGAGALTGAIPMLANGSFALDDNNTIPWFTTARSEAFIINLSAAVQLSGRIYYRREAA